MGFAELRSRLGMDQAPVRDVVDYIRECIRKRGCPPPQNPRRWAGSWRHGAEAVCQRSKWNRWLAEKWLNGDLPPAAAAAVAKRGHDHLRAQLAGNAQRLVAVV